MPRRWRLAAKSPAQTSAAACTTSCMSVCAARHLELAARDAGDVEQVVDQHQLGPDVPADQLDRAAQRRRGSSALRSSACSAITTGVSGVRSSCERMARKRSLAWLAASASARALRLSTSACTSSARLVSSACSAARACVWSRKILSRPIGCVPSRVAHRHHHAAAPEAVPFFRRCQRSSAARPSVERLRAPRAAARRRRGPPR